MGKTLSAILACLLLAANASGAQDDLQTLAAGHNAFALDLYARLRGQEGNLFFSPVSLSTALAMTYAGARGDTAAQMAKALHFDLDADRLHPASRRLLDGLAAAGESRGCRLRVANALWGQKGYGFLREFLDLTRASYGAGLNEVDFRRAPEVARKTINLWVAAQTQDQIPELVPKGLLDTLTRLVLTNAIHFQGDWLYQFDKGTTRPGRFTLTGGQTVEVPLMRQTAVFRYAEDAACQALEMPYAGKRLSMILLLPRKDDGLPALEAALTAESLAGRLARLRDEKVVVTLPKFRAASSFRLAGTLKAMGMTDAFSVSAADFSGMNGKRDLFLAAVIHQAVVDVNEEGTEAAAASAVVVEAKNGGPPRFRADHPFLFLIRDRGTGSILFLGRVMNPKG